jgi:hypothetical protein
VLEEETCCGYFYEIEVDVCKERELDFKEEEEGDVGCARLGDEEKG